MLRHRQSRQFLLLLHRQSVLFVLLSIIDSLYCHMEMFTIVFLNGEKFNITCFPRKMWKNSLLLRILLSRIITRFKCSPIRRMNENVTEE